VTEADDFFPELGLNPYDVRKTCDRQRDGSLCYKQMEWIDTWMNDDANKKALGVDPSRSFESCNMQVNQAFLMQGDGMHNSAILLPDLINDGVRLLVYAGNADYMCNFIVRIFCSSDGSRPIVCLCAIIHIITCMLLYRVMKPGLQTLTLSSRKSLPLLPRSHGLLLSLVIRLAQFVLRAPQVMLPSSKCLQQGESNLAIWLIG